MIVSSCGYFDVIGTADYIPTRLKAYRAMNKKKNKDIKDIYSTNIKYLQDVYREKRLKNITVNTMNGENFSSGLGFSMPIFLITENKQKLLRVLFGKNSVEKGAGAEMLHVAPAGMFEVKDNSKELTYKNFVTLLSKELLEEVYFGKGIDLSSSDLNDSEKQIIEPFFEKGGGRPAELSLELYWSHEIEIAYNYWDRIWKGQKTQLSNDILLHVLNHVSDEEYFKEHGFLILDPLNFRPELIVPIYVTGVSEFGILANW